MRRLTVLAAFAALLADPALAQMLPAQEAELLDRSDFDLPADFTADRTVLIAAFSREQQEVLAGDWERALSAAGISGPPERYQLFVIDNPGAIVRGFIRSGMRGELPESSHSGLILAWVADLESWLDATGLADAGDLRVLVVDRAGRVLGVESGPASVEAAARIAALVLGPRSGGAVGPDREGGE